MLCCQWLHSTVLPVTAQCCAASDYTVLCCHWLQSAVLPLTHNPLKAVLTSFTSALTFFYRKSFDVGAVRLTRMHSVIVCYTLFRTANSICQNFFFCQFPSALIHLDIKILKAVHSPNFVIDLSRSTVSSRWLLTICKAQAYCGLFVFIHLRCC